MGQLILPKKYYENMAMGHVKKAVEAFGLQVAENMRSGRPLTGRTFRVAFTKPKMKICKITRDILEHSYQDTIDYTVMWDKENLVVLAKFKKEPDYGQVEQSTQHQADITEAEAKDGYAEDVAVEDGTTVIDLEGNDVT